MRDRDGDLEVIRQAAADGGELLELEEALSRAGFLQTADDGQAEQTATLRTAAASAIVKSS